MAKQKAPRKKLSREEAQRVHNPGDPIRRGMREHMLKCVSEYYLKGMTYRAIAKKLEEDHERSVSIVTVGNYVKRLLLEWKEERVTTVDNMKTVELTRIHRLETTYWEGWERSLEGSKKSNTKQRARPRKSVAEGGEVVEDMDVYSAEKSSYTEDTYGDPRFLAGIQWCISMRCKILGIEAPLEIKGTMTSEIKRTTTFRTKTRNRP